MSIDARLWLMESLEIALTDSYQDIGSEIAMALTNVWTRSTGGEWVRTTAQEAEHRHDYSVSVYSHQFRCYSCFQYVTFVSSSADRVCHFRHSSGYTDKDCEDRSVNNGRGPVHTILSEAPTPMRLVLDRDRAFLYIGMQPIGRDELRKCISAQMQITLGSKQSEHSVYRVDESRFIPNVITWLPVPLASIDKLSVEISPSYARPRVWSGSVEPISSRGALFDAQTGRRIADKGDVVVGREYLWLVKRSKLIYGYSADVMRQSISIQDRTWTISRICARRFSASASDFFFEQVGVRLTNYPVDMTVLWPPMLVKDDVVETNSRSIHLLKKGEADFAAFPRYLTSFTATEIRDGLQLIEMKSNGAVQMVTNERYNHTLQFLYVRPIDRQIVYQTPQIDVFFDDGQPCTDTELDELPLRGVLHFSPSDDGFVTVFDGDDPRYRMKIHAGEKTRITDLKRGTKLDVHIGLECVLSLAIKLKAPKIHMHAQQELGSWHGPQVAFPHRYAWLLEHIDNGTELYRRVQLALQQGAIPRDGLQMLQQMMEEN